MNGSERVYKHDPLIKLLAAVKQSKKKFRKTKLRFLLDTDRNIENETRVGLNARPLPGCRRWDSFPLRFQREGSICIPILVKREKTSS